MTIGTYDATTSSTDVYQTELVCVINRMHAAEAELAKTRKGIGRQNSAFAVALTRIHDLRAELAKVRATVCTTDITEELERLTVQIAVAFHFVQTGNDMNYELDTVRKDCADLILNSFVKIAHPFKARAEAAEAELVKVQQQFVESTKRWADDMIAVNTKLAKATAELAKAQETEDTQRQSKEYAQRCCNEAEAELAKVRETLKTTEIEFAKAIYPRRLRTGKTEAAEPEETP